MSDCIFCFIDGFCDGNNCNGCKKYLSVNSIKGRQIFKEYELAVNEALKPIQKKFKEKYFDDIKGECK